MPYFFQLHTLFNDLQFISIRNRIKKLQPAMDIFMDQPSDGRSIKEEPFEEFLFPETVLQSTTENLVETCCFLCDEGKEILKNINEHFQAYHPGENWKNPRGNKGLHSSIEYGARGFLVS
jgi:hypothetical protein